MNKHFSKQPIALALGAAFALTGAAAHASVFQLTDLAAGYMVAADAKAGEKKADPKAEEAKCGANCAKNLKSMSEADAKAACDKAKAEGKCGSDKEKKEGKCGEGKCGGHK